LNYFNIREFLKRKFVSDSILTIGSHVFIGASGLITNSIIGIKYNSNGLGIFSQGLAIYFMLSILANFGLETSAQKHSAQYSNDKDQLKKIFVNTTITTFTISIIITILFYSIISITPQIFKTSNILSFVKLICLATPLFAINKTMNAFNVGIRNMDIYVKIRSARWVIIVSGILTFSFLGLPLHSIPKIFLFTEFCLTIYLVLLNKPYWGNIVLSEAKLHLTYGIKNMVGNFIHEFNLRIPIIIIGALLGNVQAGLFAYILSFARAVLLIPQAIQKTFNPIFTKNWYENKHQENQFNISRVFKHCLVSIIPVFIALYLFFIIYTSFLMPAEYLLLNLILIILLIGMAITYLFGPFMTFLVMTNHLYINILRILIPCAINILLILILIKNHGIMGVAISGSASIICDLFIINYFYNKFLKIKLFKYTIFSLNK